MQNGAKGRKTARAPCLRARSTTAPPPPLHTRAATRSALPPRAQPRRQPEHLPELSLLPEPSTRRRLWTPTMSVLQIPFPTTPPIKSSSDWPGQSQRCLEFRSYSGSNLPRERIRISSTGRDLPPRPFRDYLIAPAVLMIFGAGVWLIHSNDERRASSGLKPAKRFERNPQGIWPYGGPFRLISTDSKVVTEAELKGSWILMYFGYTSSPDIGPEEVQKMADVIDILENHHVEITPVYITIDPQRDSPAQLRAYLQEFHPKIIGLTGPVAATRQIAQEFRIFFKKTEEEGQDYLIESTNDMILLNPKTEIVGRYGTRYDAIQLSEAIVKEVKKAQE